MSKFIGFFALELKRFLRARNLIILLLLISVSIVVVHKKAVEYKDTEFESKEFQKTEDSTFKKLLNYTEYSKTGFNVLFVPSPSEIFFTNPALMSGLFAKINSVVALYINNNCQGKIIIKKSSYFDFCFSSIILLLGSLLALFVGLEPMLRKGYLKFLSSNSSSKNIFLSIIFSRSILLSISFLFISAIMLGVVILEKIDLTQIDFSKLLDYLVTTIIMLIFFFSIGILIGCFKRNGNGFTPLIVIWLVFGLFIPWATDFLIDTISDEISSVYKIYNEKLKIVNDWERRTVKEHGPRKDNTVEGSREVVEGYLENEFKQIEALEEQFKNEIAAVLKKYKNIKILFPTTFYNLTSYELSSRGYENFLDFYSSLQILRRQFVFHWVDHVYYKDPKILVNFVTPDENQNLYHAQSRLPENFWKGVIINSVWIILLLLLGNFLFNRRMYPVLKKPETTEAAKIDFHDTEKVEIVCREPSMAEIADQITNVFFGYTKSFKGNLSIEGESIVTKEKKHALVFSHPDTIPEDLKGRHLLALYKRSLKLTNDEYKKLRETAGLELLDKRFAKMEYMEKADVMLAIIKLKKFKTYIFYNFAFGLNAEERFQLTNKLKALGIDDVLIISIITKGDIWLQPDRYIEIGLKDGKINID